MKKLFSILTLVCLVALLQSCASFAASWSVANEYETVRGVKTEIGRSSYNGNPILDKNLNDQKVYAIFFNYQAGYVAPLLDDFGGIPKCFILSEGKEIEADFERLGRTGSQWVWRGEVSAGIYTGFADVGSKGYIVYILPFDIRSIDKFILRTEDGAYEKEFTVNKTTIDAVLSLGTEGDKYTGIYTGVKYRNTYSFGTNRQNSL